MHPNYEPMDLSMDGREQLADSVETDPKLSTAEQEVNITFDKETRSMTATSSIPSVSRRLLRHDEADVLWLETTLGRVSDHHYGDFDPNDMIDGEAVYAVCVQLTLGALTIKGRPRSTDTPSSVVNTPSDADALDGAFDGQ